MLLLNNNNNNNNNNIIIIIIIFFLCWLNSMTFVMKIFRFNCISLFCNHLVLVWRKLFIMHDWEFQLSKMVIDQAKSCNLKSCWTNKFSLTFVQNLFKHKLVKESQQFRFNTLFKKVIRLQYFHNKSLIVSCYWF